MHLRLTERRNRDGSTVGHYALAENVWNAAAKRAEARVVHRFGRADRLDREALERLVRSINRVLDVDPAALAESGPLPEIEIDRVFELGVVPTARALWEDLGIGAAVRRRLEAAGLGAPHEAALLAMAANRLDAPDSKLACAERWLPDAAWLPEAEGLKVDQLHRALDVPAMQAEAVEEEVFLGAADLFKLDVDLVFHDTITAWFTIDEEDEADGLRRRGHAKGGPEGAPQVVIALAVTRASAGRGRRPLRGSDRPAADGRRHAGALLGPARRHGRRRHRGADQGGSPRLAARPLRPGRRCRPLPGRRSRRARSGRLRRPSLRRIGRSPMASAASSWPCRCGA
jgi:hypothetical protein